jgi:hypothetical protein
MKKWLLNLLNELNKTKTYLVLTSLFLVSFLILFNNLGVLPMRTGDFVFFAILLLAFALFRPSWAFLLFLGTIALENINLAPKSLGIVIRPYQFIGGLLFLAIAIRFFGKKLPFKLTKLTWIDYLIFLIPAASLLNIFISPNPHAGLKFTLILFSFTILFLLAKNYIQNSFDLKKSLPFFFGSSLIIMLYGIWQNVRFSKGLNSFSVMPGRPNSTLAEPDWFGLYLVLVLASAYTLIYFFTKKSDEENNLKKHLKILAIYFYLVLVFVLLIISVSRSAWLGAIIMTFAFLFFIFTNLRFNFRNWQWKSTLKIKLGIISAFLVGLGVVYFFNLTTFQLFNRAVSTGGLQKITIACPGNTGCALPMTISDINEIKTCNCRHINLEDIEKEKVAGNNIKEVYRKDPNVSVRAEVYQKSFAKIKTHPILGIGWENIPTVLGKDERGANLNSSNIFLETYLGSGLIGFLSLLIILGTIFLRALISFFKENDLEQKAFALFIVISLLGIIIFNLFNAGIMLGFFWVWLGIASAIKSKKSL